MERHSQVVATGVPARFEARFGPLGRWFRRPSGRIYLDCCREPLRDESGRLTGVLKHIAKPVEVGNLERALSGGWGSQSDDAAGPRV